MNILFIDDERDIHHVLLPRFRKIGRLPEFTDKQLDIIYDSSTYVHIAKDYSQAIELLSVNQYDMIFFDHDLGAGKNGKDVANWIVGNINYPFEFYVHSYNIVGRENINSLLTQWMKRS